MLHHERRGTGPPLVLIHGIGSRRQVWEPILDEVARHREVIALDLPGFGASPLGDGAPPGSVERLADAVAGFLAELDLTRPEVAGSSLGGGIALELGRRGLAGAVTAFSPVGFWGPIGRRWCQAVVGAARGGATALGPVLPQVLATRAGRAALCAVFYAHPGRLSPADCLDSARALAAAPGFAAARSALASCPTWSAEPPTSPQAARRDASLCAEQGRYAEQGREARPRIPVTIAWGTRDLVLPYRWQARRARRALPTARHVALPGCGHLPFSDDPRRCAELLTLRQ